MLAALLAFYDEPEAFLTRMVESLPRARVTRLYALDGAYALYPYGRPESPPSQRQAILDAAERIGIHARIATPGRLWRDEMEKRSTLFRLADAHGPDDWLFVVDADYEIVDAPGNLLHRLNESGRDVATVMLQTSSGPYYQNLPPLSPMRSLFRAGLGITVDGNHWTYVTRDGRKLWGRHGDKIVPALDLTHKVRVAHHTNLRPLDRARRQILYYRARDQAGAEQGSCQRCRFRRAIGWALTDLRPLAAPRHSNEMVAGSWIEVCEVCTPVVRAEALEAAEALGLTEQRFASLQNR